MTDASVRSGYCESFCDLFFTQSRRGFSDIFSREPSFESFCDSEFALGAYAPTSWPTTKTPKPLSGPWLGLCGLCVLLARRLLLDEYSICTPRANVPHDEKARFARGEGSESPHMISKTRCFWGVNFDSWGVRVYPRRRGAKWSTQWGAKLDTKSA